jgi:oligopeptide/dipeptide ABC transporter ATP-binding protein
VTALLEAKDLTVIYGEEGLPAADRVDVSIEPGAAIGLVGESGSGKSTVARALGGLIAPTTGSVSVHGRPWSEIRGQDAARRSVQMIFQDPYGALNPWVPVKDTVAEVFRFWERVSRNQARRQAVDLLGELGLARDAMDRRPGALSGGQCQRVGIARALACSPEILLADEPTSALDVSVQAQILKILSDLRRDRGLAILLVSHDLEVVRRLTDESLVMYGGRVVERGPTDELFESPSHPYTRILVESSPGRSRTMAPTRNDVDPAHPCRYAARCPCLQDDCVELAAVRADAESGRAVECMHPLERRPAPSA